MPPEPPIAETTMVPPRSAGPSSAAESSASSFSRPVNGAGGAGSCRGRGTCADEPREAAPDPPVRVRAGSGARAGSAVRIRWCGRCGAGVEGAPRPLGRLLPHTRSAEAIDRHRAVDVEEQRREHEPLPGVTQIDRLAANARLDVAKSAEFDRHLATPDLVTLVLDPSDTRV